MNRIRVLALLLPILAACTTSMQSSIDSGLTERVRAALDADHLDGVTVTVSRGVATLTGTAPDEGVREEAQIDAERVEGVRAVANRIRVTRR